MTVNEGMALPLELQGNVERYAVYRCYSDGGELLYVGESGELGTRLASHAQKLWFTQVRGITLEWHADELSALNAERRAVHVEHPKYNKQHRRTTSAQAARAGSRKRPVRRAMRLPGEGEFTVREALRVLGEDPEISGSELGRRLGKTPGYGRTLMRRLSPSAPSGGG